MTITVNEFATDDTVYPTGSIDARQFEGIAPGTGAISIEVMRYPAISQSLRPLVIIGSVDFPMPPSVQFCDLMRDNGLQVVFIRRLGFGRSPPLPKVLLHRSQIENGAAATAEAKLLDAMLRTLGLRDLVLLGLGSANPVCYRLAFMNPEISFTIFANHAFNRGEFDIFGPQWLQRLIHQMLQTKPGIRLAELGIRHQLRSDPIKYYRQFLSKSAGDLAYAAANELDLIEASKLQARMEAATFYYDVMMSLSPDSFLKDGRFSELNAIVLTGDETTDAWKNRVELEAARLGIEIISAPSGDVFVPYASPSTLISAINSYAE